MSTNNPKKVYNLIVLDESGSMQIIKEPIVNGFNEIIQTIRNDAENDKELQQWINFYSFNGSGIREQVPLSIVSKLTELNEKTYHPDSNTPLYDAIGHACNKLRATIGDENNCAVLVTILTDGQENSSKEYSFEAIASLIQSLKNKGWVFTYIGANHDVEKIAISINISNSINFSTTKSGVSDWVAKEKFARDAFKGKLKSGTKEDLNKGFYEE
jgi:hypothetical protein